MKKELLRGHYSEETAYMIDDYPYGFRLRCKKRVWLEQGKSKGCLAWRLVEQTTNPKQEDKWNKPKKSTYCKFAAVMYLDENDHVKWSGLNEYCDADKSEKWLEENREVLTEPMIEAVEEWVRDKRIYQQLVDDGKVKIVIGRG